MIFVAEYIPFSNCYVENISIQMGSLKLVEINKVLKV